MRQNSFKLGALASLFVISACQPPADESAISSPAQTAASEASVSHSTGSVADPWHYVQVDDSKQMWGDWDEPEWLRYFGLAAGDLNGDGLQDIVSGRYVYLQENTAIQPAASKWKRIDLGDNVDAILVVDADSDDKLDIIAQALPNLYWYEIDDVEAGTFTRVEIGQVPATTHVNSQGFVVADIVGDERKEFIIAGNGSLYAFKANIKENGQVEWHEQLIAVNTSDEGIGVGDIDGDGDIDIAAGRRPQGEPEPKQLLWYENPGHIDSEWKEHYVGESTHPIDRVEIADLNGDGKGDIVFTEERYPGLEPDAEMVMFTQQDEMSWSRTVLVKQFSMNNLDIGDIDQDGDLDIVTAEHKGESLETELWLNNGSGAFTPSIIDSGKESHLGTQMVDIDNDGDLDLISAGWDQHQFVHIWLNPLISDVSITQVTHLERDHFKISTPSATFLFDQKGGGFSSIIDLEGNDWVNFKMQPWGDYPAAAAGAFRGIPNAVHNQGDDSGAGHPGFDVMSSKIVANNALLSTSKSGNWQWQYTFYPKGVKMDVINTVDDGNYWFLYEGTPGGRYDPDNSFYGTDQTGFKQDAPDFFLGTSLEGNFRWAYFSHNEALQSLFVAQLSEDNAPDVMSYLGNTERGVSSPDGMVVFGFGRDKAGSPRLNGEHAFFIGFAPYSISSTEQHEMMSNYINTHITRFSKES